MLEDSRLLVIDDNSFFRQGLIQLLHREFPVRHIDSAATGTEALPRIRTQSYDLLLVRFGLPDMPANRLLRQARVRAKGLPALIFCETQVAAEAQRCLALGARGILRHSATEQEIVDLVKQVMQGKTVIDPRLGAPAKATVNLTQREHEVLRLLCLHLSSKEIAERLFISKHTVDNHRKRILKKTGHRNTLALIQWAARSLVEPRLPTV